MVEFVIGAPQDLLSICGYWVKKYCRSPGLAIHLDLLFIWTVCYHKLGGVEQSY